MTKQADEKTLQKPKPSLELIGANRPREMPIVVSTSARELKIFLIAGEHSGDRLGGGLMAALNDRRKGRIRYFGVGGPDMTAQGLSSQFPIEDVAVMGIGAIARRLPRIARRVYQTVDAVIAAEPDAVVIIDAPEFTHPIARRIRKRRPDIPIIDYVSPSVWAWRPGRARAMRHYIDHVMGLLPFEPEVHAELGGPPCSYVGHPLIERAEWIASLEPNQLAMRLGLTTARPVLVVLPGSRASEISRLMQPFGDTIAKLMHQARHPPQLIMPVIPTMRPLIEDLLQTWPKRPHLIESEDDKFRAFKLADAALAASGTVSLELALAGTPMVVGYKVEPIMAMPLRLMIKSTSVVLANLVLGENAFPEFLQGRCEPGQLAPAVAELLTNSPVRRRQLDAIARIRAALELPEGLPSEAAAKVVLCFADRGKKGR